MGDDDLPTPRESLAGLVVYHYEEMVKAGLRGNAFEAHAHRDAYLMLRKAYGEYKEILGHLLY